MVSAKRIGFTLLGLGFIGFIVAMSESADTPQPKPEVRVVRATPAATPGIIQQPVETIVIPTATPTDAHIAEKSFRQLAEQMKIQEEAAFVKVDHKAASQYAAKRVEYEQLAELARRGVTPTPFPNNSRGLQTPFMTATPTPTPEPTLHGLTEREYAVIVEQVDKLQSGGDIISKIDVRAKEVFMDPTMWRALKYQEKQEMTAILAFYMEYYDRDKTTPPTVVIKNAYSGKRMAKLGVFGFSNEE